MILGMGQGNQETEIKLRAGGVEEAERLLRGAGFRISRGRVFEDNAVFDTPEATLRESGRLLRVRTVEGEALLTYKGPGASGKHKVREELEVNASGPETLRLILERLGYRQSFRYQKFRTEYRGAGEGVATLDETPIGVFLELEGAPEWIDRTAAALGFGEPDYITKSYAALYLAACRERGLEPGNMIFQDAQETSMSQPKPGRSDGRV